MISFKKPLIVTLAALMLLCPLSFVGANNLFTVTSVYDGDTIGCQGCGIIFRVRLAGIDAPDKSIKKRPDEPYAEEAKSYLEKLILGKKVAIKQLAIDRENLILGIVRLQGSRGLFSSDWKNINLEMLEQGYAVAKRRGYISDMRPYIEAEKKAKERKLNLWSQKD